MSRSAVSAASPSLPARIAPRARIDEHLHDHHGQRMLLGDDQQRTVRQGAAHGGRRGRVCKNRKGRSQKAECKSRKWESPNSLPFDFRPFVSAFRRISAPFLAAALWIGAGLPGGMGSGSSVPTVRLVGCEVEGRRRASESSAVTARMLGT